jgi:hypothetical protein
MARDNELRLSFSDVSSATNISAVVNDLSATNRTGFVTLTSTANQWAVGYSDSLNFTHFRDQIGDITNLVSGTVTSAIVNDPALNNGTAYNSYYLRASVSPVGFVGPEPCQFIVQGAQDVGTGAAPAGTALSSWSQISGVATCPATCTSQVVPIGGMSAATPSVVTPTGTVPPTGTIIMFTSIGGAGSWAVRSPYVVLQTSATTYIAATTLGGTTTQAAGAANSSAASVLVGNNAEALTAVGFDDASDRIAFDKPMNVGDTIIFGTLGTVTGPTVGTLYYVTSVSALGVTISTTSGGATLALGGSIGTVPFVGRVNFNNNNAVFSASGTGTTITTTAPHNLSVGQVVVPSAAAALGGLTNGVAYYVIATPTPTTLQVATTINGTAVSITAATNPLFVGRPPKIANAPVVATTRPWVRMGVQQLNGSAIQDGYIVVYGAEFSMGKDSAAVS